MHKNHRLILSCIVFIIICLLIGALAGIATSQNINPWYTALEKPFFNPPNWLFAPVWTVLYIMIGIAGGYFWHYRKIAISPIISYFCQLVLNFSWSFIFFAAHLLGWALVDMTLLWVSIGMTILFGWRVSKFASYLLIPYWVWVSYAMLLNASIWYLN